MIIQDFELSAFRALSGVKLESLTPFSLIVGANNSGKSSFLEAAGLILRPFEPPQWVQTAFHRDPGSSALAEGLWSLFPMNSVLSENSQQSQRMILNAQLKDRFRTLFAKASSLMAWNIQSNQELTEDHVLRLDLVVQENNQNSFKHIMEFQSARPAAAAAVNVHFYKTFMVTATTHRSTRLLVDHLSRVVDEGGKSLVVELLQIFDPNIQDLHISRAFEQDTIRVTHSVRGITDLSSFGDGLRRAAALALALARASKGVLLIDEIEAGIHKKVLGNVINKLITAARHANVQIIATTHSLEAIDVLIDPDLNQHLEDIAVFHLRRDNDRHQVFRYSGERLLHLREAGLDIR